MLPVNIIDEVGAVFDSWSDALTKEGYHSCRGKAKSGGKRELFEMPSEITNISPT